MNAIAEYFSDLFKGIKSLLTGMKVTGSYFVRPSQIVTQQYPENRDTIQMFDRFKGEVIMPHNSKNEHRCTGCGICEMNCPNGTIEVISRFDIVDEKRKRVLDQHIYHLGMCTFCGLCVKTCPSKALDFGKTFEHAVLKRSNLTKVLNQPNSVLTKDVKE